MSYKKNTCVCQKVIEVCKSHTGKYRKPGMKRQPKTQATPEAQIKVNENNSVKHLTRIINLNFGHGDIHLCLTYKNKNLPQSPKGAKRNLDNFLKRTKRVYTKQGLEFKYIAVTEYSTQRVNHHLIIPASDTRALNEAWGLGFIRVVYLDETGQYKGLAAYLLKETKKTFRSENRVSGKRWNSSRNIQQPESITEIIHAGTWSKEPKPLAGYYIEEVYNGVSEITGYPFQHYTMVALGDSYSAGG